MQCIFSLPGGDARKILIYLTVASAMKKLSLQELQRPSVEEFKTRNRLPVIVVLDNVRSGHNTGSVFRTCDAFGIEGLYLCGITPCPPNREVLKTALGSEDSMDWQYFPETKVALAKLKDDQFDIVLAEHTTASIPLQLFNPPREKRLALVFGNEVSGIQELLLPMANHVIEIPQFGTKHSFNISVAAGIVLWELWNKMREK